jgi:hypothetical protein
MALAFGAAALPAMAATPTTPAPVKAVPATKAAPSAVKKAAAQRTDNLSLSRDGYQTMRDIRMARIAIFHGDTRAAGEFLKDATRSMDVVDQAAARRTRDVKSDLLPIDGEIVLADNYIDTPAKRAHVNRANEHLTQGRAKEANDELRLAEIDASFTEVLMPVDATRRHLNAATTLMSAKQFYEANLALKAAEDGLLVNTVAISEAPAPERPPQANQ